MVGTSCHPRRYITSLGLALTILVGVVATTTGTTSVGAAPSVRGFDGSTITVAGIGIKGQLPNAPLGSQARIKRFNDDNEIPGVKIKYADFADDKQDPATALSEARRLVTQVQVFAIVGDISANNPGEYLTQQHVPWFGWAFDDTYCSHNPSTAVWGFAYSGCIIASDPSWIGDIGKSGYTYVSGKTGKAHPTIVIVGNDTASGKTITKQLAIAFQGAGFKIADVQNQMPAPPISDYTPYVQAALTGDNGKAPDAINCAAATDCLPIWSLLQANGYQGAFLSGLYSDIIVKPMNGSAAQGSFVNPLEDTPGMRQLKTDLDAFEPGAAQKIDSAVIASYSSTDMFIQALKKVAKQGKSAITPENVQKVAARQTWEIKGLAGPTSYPKSTVFSYPSCMSMFESNGTEWTTAVPYRCSTKTYSPNTKIR